jgi:uncharacterized protein (TIGR00299 family) protein
MLAYFDCFSGISGDMTLGALLDLGAPLEWLKEKISGMPLEGFDVSLTQVHRNGIRANMVRVQVDDHQPARNFSEIKLLIESSPLPAEVKSASMAIFGRLAQVEAEIHGCSPEEVHFHEVGGVDAIVDIVGTCLCLEFLGIKHIAASKIPIGKGFVNCRHGKLPVPAPATVALLKDVPVYGTEIEHELVTPTGAAIIVSLAQSFAPMPDMLIKKIGYGAGQRDLVSRPNLLRIITGEVPHLKQGLQDNLQSDRVSVVETCIDDMNPEIFGFLMDRLFDDGALDVCWIPVHMKKNRPGTMIQVLCSTDKRDTVIRRILSETTSLGVRYYEAWRRLLYRNQLKIQSSYGLVTVKHIKDPLKNSRLVPEFEICKKIALEKGVPLRKVYETIAAEAAKIDIADF